MSDKRRKPRLESEDKEPVSKRDLEDAFSQLASAPAGKLRSENREPTREQLRQRYRLVRR